MKQYLPLSTPSALKKLRRKLIGKILANLKRENGCWGNVKPVNLTVHGAL
jgi:hypothetical protein